MQTLYIDVYFLINLTVDMLALHFSGILSAVPLRSRKLLFSSFLGALLASVGLFLPDNPYIRILFLLFGNIFITLVATGNVKFRRRIRFGIAFIVLVSVIGTLVGVLWDIFDKYLYDSLAEVSSEPVNRKLLLLSVSILLCIGVIKMILTFFSDGAVMGGKASVEIVFRDKSITVDALIDSGNLAVDPINMCPVMLIKPDAAARLFPKELIELGDPDLLERDVRRRVRLIPVSRLGATHVLVGIKPDSARLIDGKRREELFLTVAIDKEGGSYSGYQALMPLSAIKKVI